MIEKVKYKEFEDKPFSTLIPFEFSELPFVPKRAFMVHMFPNSDYMQARGGHASKENKQFIYCLDGSFIFRLNFKETLVLEAGEGFYLPEKTWVTYLLNEGGNVHLPPSYFISFCSHPYDPEDYFESKDQFEKEVLGKK